MINIRDTVSTFIHIPMMFLSTDLVFDERIEQFTMDLLYIRLTHQAKDDHLACSELSNWFSL